MFLVSRTNRAMIRIQRIIKPQRWSRISRTLCGAQSTSNKMICKSSTQQEKQKNHYPFGSFLPVVALGIVANCSSSDDDNNNENAKSGKQLK